MIPNSSFPGGRALFPPGQPHRGQKEPGLARALGALAVRTVPDLPVVLLHAGVAPAHNLEALAFKTAPGLLVVLLRAGVALPVPPRPWLFK